MVDRESRVVGYYTLSAYALQGPDLPPALARKLPRYPLIPATFLGRLAIGLEHQGQKLGALLLLDALNRSWKNADVVASVGVVAEAINETARKFYLRHEFSQLGSHPGRVFLPMETIEKLFR
ncbi:MAG: GNAT family N-acetyltransferase [Bryobacteraceae bacterium]